MAKLFVDRHDTVSEKVEYSSWFKFDLLRLALAFDLETVGNRSETLNSRL